MQPLYLWIWLCDLQVRMLVRIEIWKYLVYWKTWSNMRIFKFELMWMGRCILCFPENPLKTRREHLEWIRSSLSYLRVLKIQINSIRGRLSTFLSSWKQKMRRKRWRKTLILSLMMKRMLMMTEIQMRKMNMKMKGYMKLKPKIKSSSLSEEKNFWFENSKGLIKIFRSKWKSSTITSMLSEKSKEMLIWADKKLRKMMIWSH